MFRTGASAALFPDGGFGGARIATSELELNPRVLHRVYYYIMYDGPRFTASQVKGAGGAGRGGGRAAGMSPDCFGGAMTSKVNPRP